MREWVDIFMGSNICHTIADFKYWSHLFFECVYTLDYNIFILLFL